mgnify:CR=1 FL=1|tara:strand:+ start:220 stop:381 length:162 start_codon:yes stop_codon:yes gene_type:complete
MSPYERDNERISFIMFKMEIPFTEKNKMVCKIEDKMAKMEQLELDGKGTGYYE